MSRQPAPSGPWMSRAPVRITGCPWRATGVPNGTPWHTLRGIISRLESPTLMDRLLNSRTWCQKDGSLAKHSQARYSSSDARVHVGFPVVDLWELVWTTNAAWSEYLELLILYKMCNTCMWIPIQQSCYHIEVCIVSTKRLICTWYVSIYLIFKVAFIVCIKLG